MNAEARDVSDAIKLPVAVARRGIDEAQWRTLANNLYPGAAGESVLMVVDYCKARGLDPLKKPCHIVPMEVRDAKTGEYHWRDVVMPGIYEYRTTAARTGQYLGHSRPEYGPIAEHMGVSAPEWVEMSFYRWNEASKSRVEFPVRTYFRECVGTRYDKDTKGRAVNARWRQAPIQMLTKVCEAAGLREAFPDELGGTHTEEEMAGQVIDSVAEPRKGDGSGRPDTTDVDWDLRDKWVGTIVDTMAADLEEWQIAVNLREIDLELNRLPELYVTVFDKLASDGIITRAKFREYLKIQPPASA